LHYFCEDCLGLTAPHGDKCFELIKISIVSILHSDF
jgi:hypothetical protein